MIFSSYRGKPVVLSCVTEAILPSIAMQSL